MAESEQSQKQFQEYVKLQNDKVKRNIKEVTNESLGQSFLLHIDGKTPNYFIPMMPRRAAPSEDNTVPRVTVSDTLLGCIIGYSAVSHDFHTQKTNGLYINKIDFDYCLQPSTKLVYDADITNEHWLVTYNKDTIKYKPVTIGKMFVHKITYDRSAGNTLTDETAEILIEIEDNIKIKFSESIMLSKGYYRAIIDMTHWEEDKLKVNKISAVEYAKHKNVSASMLDNMAVNIPLYTHW